MQMPFKILCYMLVGTIPLLIPIFSFFSMRERKESYNDIETLTLQNTSLMKKDIFILYDQFRSEEAFFNEVQRLHVNCKQTVKMGDSASDGHDLCTYGPYKFQDPCLGYSFGWSEDTYFEEDVIDKGCTVRLFLFNSHYIKLIHPRNSLNIHNVQFCGYGNILCCCKPYNVLDVDSIYKKFQEETEITDIVRVDLKLHAMIKVLKILVNSKWLDTVKQLILHIRLNEVDQKTTKNEEFHSMLESLSTIEKRGFRKFKTVKNFFGVMVYHGTRGNALDTMDRYKDENVRSCCYDLYYVNGKFVDIFG